MEQRPSKTKAGPSEPPPRKRTKQEARTEAPTEARTEAPTEAPTEAMVITSYFLIDEGNPQVYTLEEGDGTTHEIDEGEDVSNVVQRFLEIGWELYGKPWTYVDGRGRARHCQAVVCMEPAA